MSTATITADTDLNEAARIVHAANAKWWQNVDTGRPLNRNPFELLALVISEVAECLEGERKDLLDDKLPNRKMAEVEMADAYIRLLDFSGGFEIPLERSRMMAVMATNKGEALFDLMRRIAETGEAVALHRDPSAATSICLSHIETYCHIHGYDLWGAINQKMDYNRTRIDHTHEARRIAGGKQF